MRQTHARCAFAITPCLLLVALAGCGGAGLVANHNATSNPTTNTKGAATPGASATPTPEILPYMFPAAWQNAVGPLAVGPCGYGFAPSNQRIGYACSVGRTPFTVTGDGGASWRSVAPTPFTTCESVFIDGQDPNDVFITQSVPFAPNPPQTQDQLWRTRDGGATWQKLGMADGEGQPLGWSDLAVVGSRLIGSAYVNGEGGLNNSLYFSDDGGLTWQPLAQNIADQHYALNQFVTVGATIYIGGMPGNGPAGYAAWPAAGRHPVSRGASQQVGYSGSPVDVEHYWRSTDGGNTWAPVWTSLTLIGGLPTFVRAANGAGYYGLAITKQTSYDGGNANDATLAWSADGGATWRQLPDIRGSENDFVVGGGFESIIAPDGTVFAAGQHAQAGYGDDAGVFVIHPNSAAPAWSPEAPGGVHYWQATVTPTGVRLWGVGASTGDTFLQFVDVA